MSRTSQKPSVLILGTFHMRYTPDLYRTEMNDVMESKRQKEIEYVVDSLVSYKPTKIAFEIVTKKNDELNANYKKYLHGDFKLAVDEVHQFGFRAASKLRHKELYAIDWMELVGNRAFSHVYEWAQENQPQFYAFINEKYPHQQLDMSLSIPEILTYINSDEYTKRSHELYMQVAKIGKLDDYVGIDWLRWWYQRNLILYSNLTRLAVNEDDRVLFIVGSSHVHLIKQFLLESGDYEVEHINNYMKV